MQTSIHPLRAYRESFEPPLSQEALGKQIGAKKPMISRWENRIREIPFTRVPKIAKVTGIPPRELRPDLADLLER